MLKFEWNYETFINFGRSINKTFINLFPVFSEISLKDRKPSPRKFPDFYENFEEQRVQEPRRARPTCARPRYATARRECRPRMASSVMPQRLVEARPPRPRAMALPPDVLGMLHTTIALQPIIRYCCFAYRSLLIKPPRYVPLPQMGPYSLMSPAHRPVYSASCFMLSDYAHRLV